jgi:hypothetical protein
MTLEHRVYDLWMTVARVIGPYGLYPVSLRFIKLFILHSMA